MSYPFPTQSFSISFPKKNMEVKVVDGFFRLFPTVFISSNNPVSYARDNYKFEYFSMLLPLNTTVSTEVC